jgi:hypothetical protein
MLGFQQALLAAGGITPSGVPDKVGASQYVEALAAVRNALRALSNTWTAPNTFNQATTFAAPVTIPAVAGALDLVTPVTVRRIIPLTDFVPIDPPGLTWELVEFGTFGDDLYLWSQDAGARLRCQVRLPDGARFQSLRLFVDTPEAGSINVQATRLRNDTDGSPSATKTRTPSGLDAILASSVTGPHLYQYYANLNLEMVAATDVVDIRIQHDSASVGFVQLYWAEIEYTYTRLLAP